MMPLYLIWLEIQGKVTGPGNIGHTDLQKYEVTRSMELNKYPKYDAYLLDRTRDNKAKSLYHEKKVTVRFGWLVSDGLI